MTAGALARWLLWNKETLREGVADYLRRFVLTPRMSGVQSVLRAREATVRPVRT